MNTIELTPKAYDFAPGKLPANTTLYASHAPAHCDGTVDGFLVYRDAGLTELLGQYHQCVVTYYFDVKEVSEWKPVDFGTAWGY